MDFFRFLLNLKFQFRPLSVFCMSKTIRFSKVRKPFRVSICGLLQKTKIVLQKTFKTFSDQFKENLIAKFRMLCSDNIFDDWKAEKL